MKHLRNSSPSLQLAFVSDSRNNYLENVFSGFCNFCSGEEGVEAVRFDSSRWLSRRAINYVEVDGIVGPFIENQFPPEFGGSEIPIVNVSNAKRRTHFPSVTNDDLSVGNLAATFFLRKPAKTFACLTAELPWHSIERLIGFKRTLSGKAQPFTYEILRYLRISEGEDYSRYFESMRKQYVSFLQKLQRPAAVFCTSDEIAVNLMCEAANSGWSLPADLRILGCDNSPNLVNEGPAELSSIELSGNQIGWLAAQSIVKILRGEKVKEKERIPPMKVVERSSTGAVKFSRLVSKAVAILQRECRNTINIQAIAEKSGCSRRSLEMAFTKETGYSPYEFVIQKRLDLAQQMLRDTDVSISRIAEDSGFGDLRTMGTYFRRNMGISPRLWRKINQIESTRKYLSS